MIPTYKAESLADFIARIKEIREEWDNPKDDDQVGLWFRGLQKSNWPLVPGLYRYLDRKTKVYEAEDEICEDFVKRAPSLTERRNENQICREQRRASFTAPGGLPRKTDIRSNLVIAGATA